MDQVTEEQADGKLQITNSTAKTHGCFVAAITYFPLSPSLSPFPPLTVDCNFQDNTATAKKMYKH